jgi:hypothetical protein
MFSKVKVSFLGTCLINCIKDDNSAKADDESFDLIYSPSFAKAASILSISSWWVSAAHRPFTEFQSSLSHSKSLSEPSQSELFIMLSMASSDFPNSSEVIFSTDYRLVPGLTP